MHLKIRQLIVQKPLTMVALLVGMILMALSDHWLLLLDGFILGMGQEQLYETFGGYKYLVVIQPTLILSALYATLKLSKQETPLGIGLIVALTASLPLFFIKFVLSGFFSFVMLATDLIAILSMVATWVILLQTSDETSKSFGLGFFSYLVIYQLSDSAQSVFIGQGFEVIPFLLSICFAGILASIFGFLMKVGLKLIRLSKE